MTLTVNQCLKLWGPVVYHWVIIMMSWRNRKAKTTLENQAQGCFFILWYKSRNNWFTEEKKSGQALKLWFKRKMKLQVPTDLPRAKEVCREQALRGFLTAPRNMLFLWWSSVSTVDFLFLIWNLQTVFHPRLLVSFQFRWLTAAEKYPTF